VKELKPVKLAATEVAFPANVVGRLLPRWEDLPKEFRQDSTDYCHFVSRWFSVGSSFKPKVKEGLDEQDVWRHLKACMGSFEPKHEHKVAGVAYLMSLWCEPLPENWRKLSVTPKK
jgi:hypothetical protein